MHFLKLYILKNYNTILIKMKGHLRDKKHTVKTVSIDILIKYNSVYLACQYIQRYFKEN